MTTQPITILGVDSGTRACGLCVLAGHDLLYSAQVTLKGATLGERLAQLEGAVARVGGVYQPHFIAVEVPIRYPGHTGGQASVGQGFGIVAAAAYHLDIPLLEVLPKQAKAALAGDGGADKKAMQRAVWLRYRVEVGEDEADSIGVAMAAMGRLPAHVAGGRSGE